MKVLITGGAGLLGSYWANHIKNKYEIHATYNLNKPNYDGTVFHQIDLLNSEKIEHLIDQILPSIIIHTVGITNVEDCENNPEEAYKTNVLMVKSLAKICHKKMIKLVNISTDHLYNGEKSFYTELDTAEPLNVYATTKLQGEKVATDFCPSSLNIRTNFFGKSISKKTSYTDWIVKNLKDKKVIAYNDDCFFTPIQMSELIDFVHLLVEKNQCGIFNVCGSERISKYQFALRVCEILNANPTLIKKTTMDENKIHTQRPKDMSLSNEKLINVLGVKPKSLMESLNDLLR